MSQKIVNLTPPKLSKKYIKEKITCIRPHRERIFQVYMQEQDNKNIFNNYGHGGAGWTFLFGSVNKSINQFEQCIKENTHLKDDQIVIIGAGCYGMLTAIILKRKGYNVKIIAADTKNIPSQKAAGFFFPRWRKCSNQEEIEIFKSMGIESYKTYLQISENKHPFIKIGPKIMLAYFGLDINPGFEPYIEQGLVATPEQVVINFGNGNMHTVMEYKIIYTNPSIIMSELERNIKELNIQIIKEEIESFVDIKEQIIFNCAGMGAKKLTGDKRIIPVQGHLITLQNQPDMGQLQYMLNVKVTVTNPDGKLRDELIYYAPREGGILGITFIRGQDSLTANAHEFDRLLDRCKNFFGLS